MTNNFLAKFFSFTGSFFVVGVFAGALSLLTDTWGQSNQPSSVIEIISALEQEIKLVNDAQARSEKTQDDYLNSLRMVAEQLELSGGGVELIKLAEVNSRLARIEHDLEVIETIETAIVESPERAMSVPMLRRDLEAMKTELADLSKDLAVEMDRMYDLGKWIVGLFGTMALGVLGLAVGNFLRKPE